MHLEELGFDLLEVVLSYLSMKEKSAVACTCKVLKDQLNNYWYHQWQTLDHKHVVEKFLENQFVFQHEKHIASKLIDFSCRQRYINAYTLGNTHRQLVANVDYFPHRGNSIYIPVKYSNEKERNIVVLKTVCWLEIVHKFDEVFPGYYYALFCIKLKNVNWPSRTTNTVINIKNEETLFVKTEITEEEWYKMEEKTNWQDIKLQSCEIVETKESDDWFFLQLGPFEIKKTCNVDFYFNDCSSWWKSGIYWDYIELRPVVT